MPDIIINSEVARLFGRAYSIGIETSLRELTSSLGLSEKGILEATVDLVSVLDGMGLELVPSPYHEEFDTRRILRQVATTSDSEAGLRRLLSEGEGANVEFKSSMHCSMRDWHKSRTLNELPSLPGELLKTICAFLNGNGGELLVGVDDEGRLCEGIKLDNQLKGWDLDKWQLHFQSLIHDRFHDGGSIQPHLRTQMSLVEDSPIFHVSVIPRTEPSFVKKEKGKPYEYFVRNGPRTDSLDYPAFYSHLMMRLGSTSSTLG